MSFINNLLKNFIRSAVNQVGRDGGRVISNKVYGDAHSKPIRITDSSGGSKEVYEDIEIGDKKDLSKEDYLALGYKTAKFENSFWTNLFILIGSLIIPFIGALYWVIRGVMLIFKSKGKLYIKKNVSVYKSDLRTKSGRRHIGYRNQKVYTPKEFRLTFNQRLFNFFKALFVLFIAYLGFIFWYDIFNTDYDNFRNLDIDKTNKSATATTIIELKEKPDVDSEDITTIFRDDSVILLGKEEISKDSSRVWYYVSYRDTLFNKTHKGWISNPLKQVKGE